MAANPGWPEFITVYGIGCEADRQTYGRWGSWAATHHHLPPPHHHHCHLADGRGRAAGRGPCSAVSGMALIEPHDQCLQRCGRRAGFAWSRDSAKRHVTNLPPVSHGDAEPGAMASRVPPLSMLWLSGQIAGFVWPELGVFLHPVVGVRWFITSTTCVIRLRNHLWMTWPRFWS